MFFEKANYRMIVSLSANRKLAVRRTDYAMSCPTDLLSPDVLTVQGTERRVGVFQEQWQMRRMSSRTLAKIDYLWHRATVFALLSMPAFSRTLSTYKRQHLRSSQNKPMKLPQCVADHYGTC